MECETSVLHVDFIQLALPSDENGNLILILPENSETKVHPTIILATEIVKKFSAWDPLVVLVAVAVCKFQAIQNKEELQSVIDPSSDISVTNFINKTLHASNLDQKLPSSHFCAFRIIYLQHAR